eukprot:Nk52_evm7s485 gene=Nk52_evmTU7s485
MPGVGTAEEDAPQPHTVGGAIVIPSDSTQCEALNMIVSDAHTLVLMLNSPEPSVLVQACDAIMSFTEEAPGNRLELLKLGAMEPLHKMLCGTNRLVLSTGATKGEGGATGGGGGGNADAGTATSGVVGLDDVVSVKKGATMCVAALSENREARKELRRLGTMEPILGLLRKGGGGQQSGAATQTNARVSGGHKEERGKSGGGKGRPRTTSGKRDDGAGGEGDGAGKEAGGDDAAAIAADDSEFQEFISQTLLNMAQDYAGMNDIFRLGGLEDLVGLLTNSGDPDVQKNSVCTVSLLVKEYQCRIRMSEINGIDPLISLLDSEYQEIQEEAMSCLAMCAKNYKNRQEMHRLNLLERLIELLDESYAELHGKTLRIIANCLQDDESVLQFQKGGGFGELVNILSTSQSPIELEYAVEAILMAVHNPNNLSAIDSEGCTGILIKLLSSGSADSGEQHASVVSKAANAIALLATNKQISASIVEQLEGLPTIISLIGSGADKFEKNQDKGAPASTPAEEQAMARQAATVREKAALALANITAYNADTKIEAAQCGAIEPLVALLSCTQVPTAQANAACALHNLAKDPGNRTEIHSLGGTVSLAKCLLSTNPNVQRSAAQALSECVHDSSVRVALCEPLAGVEEMLSKEDNSSKNDIGTIHQASDKGSNSSLFKEEVSMSGIGLVCQLLDSEYTDVRRQAAWCIRMSAVDDETALHVCSYRGLEKLRELSQPGNPIEKFAKAALDKVLNQTLAAKYWLRGVLSGKNRICDRFYDCGQAKKGSSFYALSMLTRFSVDNRRPVILVDAQSDPEFAKYVSEVEQMEMDRRQKRELLNPLLSAGLVKPNPSTEPTEQKEDNEVVTMTDEERAIQEQKLQAAQEELEKEIAIAANDVAEQARALAVFVSDQMGGVIPRDKISSFNFELPIATLKMQLKSNVVPIGMIKAGIFYHRGLLFKALADRIGLQCSLVRGEYGRAWNVISIAGDEGELYPSDFIVDVMHVPGRLMKMHSVEAIEYQMLEY